MAKLQIRKLGDEVLRKTCRPVDEITPRILTLLDDMVETMRAADGCGLAAPQVGILRRIVVVEVEPGEVYELINPKIIAFSGEEEDREGCLSVPGQWGLVKRPVNVTVRPWRSPGTTFWLAASATSWIIWTAPCISTRRPPCATTIDPTPYMKGPHHAHHIYGHPRFCRSLPPRSL